jgi:hypothetical protein
MIEKPVRGFVDELSAVSHSTGDTEALAERTGGHVHEVQTGSRVTFEVGLQGSEFHLKMSWK